MRTTASDRCLRPRSAPPKRLRLSPKARAAAPANVQFTHQAGAVTGGGRVKDSESSPPPSPLPGPVLLRAERVARRAYAARCRCQVSCRGAHGWVCRARWAAAQTFRYARATRALLCRDCFLWPVGYREGGLARAWLHLTARAALRRKRQMILQWERKKKKTREQEQTRHTMLRRRYTSTKKVAGRLVLSPSPTGNQQVPYPPTPRINRHTGTTRPSRHVRGKMPRAPTPIPRQKAHRSPKHEHARRRTLVHTSDKVVLENRHTPTSDLQDATGRVWCDVARRPTAQENVTNVQGNP